mgnify:CR=1 FL=1
MTKKIVFFVGYSTKPWNANTMLPGGSEVAVVNISKRLVKFGHEVYVAGEVIDEDIDGVKWRNYNTFIEEFKDKPSYFHAIIGVNYIHMRQYAELSNQTDAYQIFYMHNTDYFPWYKGEAIENYEQQFKDIKHIICVSNWQAEYILDNLYDGDCEGTIIQSLNNGINHKEFSHNISKDPTKFIWSSAIDRGLQGLLDNWWKIKQFMPDATLDVYYPEYSNPRVEGSSWHQPALVEKLEFLKEEGVTEYGTVSQKELHLAMQRASYWMYLTDYTETFCITALEMAESNVLRITTDVAALKERNRNGICIPRDKFENLETLYDEAIKVLRKSPRSLNEKVLKKAKDNNKIYTWDSPAYVFNEIAKNIN